MEDGTWSNESIIVLRTSSHKFLNLFAFSAVEASGGNLTGSTFLKIN